MFSVDKFEFHCLRGEKAAPSSGGAAADPPVSSARKQQGEAACCWVGIVFLNPSGSVPTPHQMMWTESSSAEDSAVVH